MNAEYITNDNDNNNEEEKPYTYFEQTVTNKVHHFYISEGIREPSRYSEIIHRIRTANSEETVCIHLNSPGGHVDTGIQLINAMRSSNAHVVASVESEACSLATMIFLAADEMVVHDDCMMMFHNFSAGAYGKGHELKANVKGVTDWLENFMRKLYIPFLSKDEFERLLKGEDFWMQSEEIRDRLQVMVEHMKKEMEAEEKAEKKKKAKKKVTKKKAGKKKTKKKVTKKKRTTKR